MLVKGSASTVNEVIISDELPDKNSQIHESNSTVGYVTLKNSPKKSGIVPEVRSGSICKPEHFRCL